MRLFTLIILTAAFFAACAPSSNTQQETTSVPEDYGNPPASGFDEQGSDAKAMEIADAVMEAMGGRKSWDNTRHIKWTFFGRRTLTWDKFTGNVRIEIPADSMTILVNINELEGRVFQGGNEMTQPDSVTKFVDRGNRIWINDAYWLVMPFKLKDSGVTLTYVGEDSTQAGELADLLELRFEEVGVTPQNKYQVWVDKNSHLVTQWSYYPNAEDEEPRFIIPWLNYEKHGEVLLSGDRGERKLENIEVFDELPESVYTGL